MNSRIFVSLLVTAIGIGALFGHRWESNQINQTLLEFDRHGDFEKGPTPQSTHDRIWKTTKNKRLWSSDPSKLIGPLYAKVGPRGNIAVFDYGDMGVKELSPKGTVLSRYGEKHEFHSLTDIAFDQNGGVWVADNSSRQIVVFNRERMVNRTIPTSVGPFRLVNNRDAILLMIPYPHQAPFARLNLAGKTQKLFGKLATNQHEGILALSGWIESTNDGGFLYVSEYTGAIARYTNQDQPVYFRSAIDPENLPRVLTNSRGFIYVDREAPSKAFNISVDDTRIYVLAPAQIGLKKIGAIDAYDTASGSYLHSLHIPEACEQAIVKLPYIYTVNGNLISKWRTDVQ